MSAELWAPPSELVPSSPADIASECRDAALGFVNVVARSGGPREFIEWAVRRYRRATRHLRVPGAPLTLAGVRPDSRAMPDIVRDTRLSVVDELENAALAPERARFVDWSVAHGLVAPFEDRSGARGWLPVDGAGRLRERVLALFAVDWLVNPESYVRGLAVCHLCESVVLDEVTRETGFCSAHEVDKRWSGVHAVAATVDRRH